MSRCVESREITNKIGGNQNISSFWKIYTKILSVYTQLLSVYTLIRSVYTLNRSVYTLKIHTRNFQNFKERKQRIYAVYERIYAGSSVYTLLYSVYTQGYLLEILPLAYKYALALLSPRHAFTLSLDLIYCILSLSRKHSKRHYTFVLVQSIDSFANQ